MTTASRPTFRLTLRALRRPNDTSGMRRLRAALKVLLRTFGLRCTAIDYLTDPPTSPAMYTETPAQEAQRQKTFTYHRPSDGQPDRYHLIRRVAMDYALLLNTNCPPSRELSEAQKHLELAVMYANAAIARNEQ